MRHIDLPFMLGRCMADLKPWQQSKRDRLPVNEYAPVITAWLAMTVATVASSTMGSRNISG